MDEKFRKVEEQYFTLRGKFEMGRITRAQFESALKDFVFQDADGRYWMLGVDTGKWHVHEGNAWVERDPEGQASAVPGRPTTLPEAGGQPKPTVSVSAPPPPSVKKSGGCGRNLLIRCLVLFILAIVLGVAGFIGVRSGALTQNKLLNLVGQGPADIEVDDFRDDAIQVNITRVDPVGSGTPTPSPSGMRLNSFDVRSHRVQNPGRYRIEFSTVRGNADLGSCTLTLRGGDHYQFVALPERIVVNRASNPSSAGTDFLIQPSALCR